MVSRVAIIRRGVVENVAVVDDEADWKPAGRPTLITLDDDSPVGPGWRYRNGEFKAPKP